MHGVTTIGLDIAKSVFQVHGIDAIGQVVIRRQLKRRYVLAFFQKLAPCVVGILGDLLPCPFGHAPSRLALGIASRCHAIGQCEIWVELDRPVEQSPGRTRNAAREFIALWKLHLGMNQTFKAREIVGKGQRNSDG